MMKSGGKCRALALFALAAAALLLVFSRCSPLYPTNNWGEANAFFTVGRGMLAGKVPYRDLRLGAGPMVYGLHALAAVISPSGFLGVWLIEIAALTALLYFAWRAAVQISGLPVLSAGMVVLTGLMLVSGRAFVYGDTVEEFALPLQMFAIGDLLAYLRDDERRFSVRRMMLHGFLAGCVFWLKYTLTGVHLAFIAAMAVDAMVRQREMRGAVRLCLEFAAGLALSVLPWLAYFGANDALSACVNVYLGGNWKNFAENMTPVRDACAALASGMKHHPAAALMMLCAGGYLLHRLVHRRWNEACTAVLAAFACAALLAYADGERYRFSPMAVGAFLMLCAGPLALLARHAWRKRKAYGALVSCAALACAGHACVENENLPMIGYPGGKLPQVQFAQYMEEHGGGEMLTYAIPDNGFYLAADMLPESTAFCSSDAYGYNNMWNEQDEDAENDAPEWLISRRSYVPRMYVKVLTASSPYDRSTSGKKGLYSYYLYRRIEK